MSLSSGGYPISKAALMTYHVADARKSTETYLSSTYTHMEDDDDLRGGCSSMVRKGGVVGQVRKHSRREV